MISWGKLRISADHLKVLFTKQKIEPNVYVHNNIHDELGVSFYVKQLCCSATAEREPSFYMYAHRGGHFRLMKYTCNQENGRIGLKSKKNNK